MLTWIQDDIGYFANAGYRQASVWREGKYWRWAVFISGAKVSGARSHKLDEAQSNAGIMLKRFGSAPPIVECPQCGVVGPQVVECACGWIAP
jgi:hypothetical protein